MAQLSGEPTLRHPERISFVHGEYTPAPPAQRLRLLFDASRGPSDQVRSAAREFEGAGRKADPAAPVRRGKSAEGDERFRRAIRGDEHPRQIVQGTGRKNQRIE